MKKKLFCFILVISKTCSLIHYKIILLQVTWIFFKNKYMYWHLIEKKSFWIRKILMTFWLGSCMVNGPKTKPGKPLCAVVINYYLWYLFCSTPRSLYEILSCARYLAQQGENISSGHMVAVLSSREFGQSAPPTFQKLLSNCHQDGKNT